MKKRTLAIIAIVLAAAVALARIVGMAARSREAPRHRAPASYRESPILRERVERGDLPPVEKRLPDQPLVVPPVEGIGRYDSDPVRRP